MSQQRKNDATQNDWSRWLYSQGQVVDGVTGSFVGLGLGFTDVDTVAMNHNNGNLIVIETKERLAPLRPSQQLILQALHTALTQSLGPKFRGCHLLQFEGTSPNDGYTTIRSFNGERWALLHEDYSSSLQVQQWFLERML